MKQKKNKKKLPYLQSILILFLIAMAGRCRQRSGNVHCGRCLTKQITVCI